MKKYQEMTQEELRFEYDAVSAKYQQYCAQAGGSTRGMLP